MVNKLSKRHDGNGENFLKYTVKCPCCGKQEGRRIFDSPGEIKENSTYDNK